MYCLYLFVVSSVVKSFLTSKTSQAHRLKDSSLIFICISPTSLLLGLYNRKKELATLTGRAPELCGWALFCVQALSSSCPPWLGSVSRPCPPLVLCGWALSSSCLPLVLVLAAPLNSVAGLCGPALCPGLVLLLSLSWPRP